MIFHITTWDEWMRTKEAGFYTPSSLATEGFIHCSTREQVIMVANQFYRGQTGLVLLCINEAQIASEVRFEPPAEAHPTIGGKQLFPHIYGPLNVDAVVQALDFPPGVQGSFDFPDGAAH